MSSRVLTHLFRGWFLQRRAFPSSALESLTRAVADGEQRHLGEVAFAVESRLSPWQVVQGLTPRERAAELFGRLRVWDTEYNTGILIYVLLAERRIEILADRGICARVAQAEWDAICADMRQHYAQGRWLQGSMQAISRMHAVLARYFPAGDGPNPDELSNRPVML